MFILVCASVFHDQYTHLPDLNVKYVSDLGGFYILLEPTNTQVLVVICDRGLEDDAMFSTDDVNC